MNSPFMNLHEMQMGSSLGGFCKPIIGPTRLCLNPGLSLYAPHPQTPRRHFQVQSCCSNNKRLWAVAMSLILTSACGGGGSGGGSTGASGTPDTISPSVSSMTPGEDGQGGTGTNAKLAVTFSESMQLALINPENFRLTDGANAIAGVVRLDTINNIATFAPISELAPNTRYTATVVTGVKDLSENTLNTDFAWCFVTSGSGDSNAPSVTATFPISAATGVPVNRKITATFSEEIDSFTLSTSTFKVTDAGNRPVSGTVTYRGGVAMFTPAQKLAPNVIHTATILTGVMDLAGNALQTNQTWSFTTSRNTDVAAPVVVFTSPVNAETNVAISRAIDIGFDKAMDPASITTGNFKVTGPGVEPVIGTVAFNASSNTATFVRINHLITPVAFHPEPVSNLEPNTVYTVTLGAGAKDMAGNSVGAGPAWSFTTAQ